MGDTNDALTPPGGTQTDAGNGGDASKQDGGGASIPWESRLNGATAKINELMAGNQAKDAQLAEALKRISDLESGKVSAEEALKAQLAAKDREIEAERSARKLEKFQLRFPEALRELGDAALSMDEAKLAALEARLAGSSGDGGNEPPTPGRHNGAQGGSRNGKSVDDMSYDELEKALLTGTLPGI